MFARAPFPAAAPLPNQHRSCRVYMSRRDRTGAVPRRSRRPHPLRPHSAAVGRCQAFPIAPAWCLYELRCSCGCLCTSASPELGNITTAPAHASKLAQAPLLPFPLPRLSYFQRRRRSTPPRPILDPMRRSPCPRELVYPTVCPPFAVWSIQRLLNTKSKL